MLFRSDRAKALLGRASLLLAAALLAAPQGARAQSPPPEAPGLGEVLAGMNHAAAAFKNAQADLDYTKVTVLVDDHSTERGKIYFETSKGKTRVMLAFQEPAEKYVLFKDDKVSIYRPKIAEVQEYSLAKSQGLLEQFLLLGFGTSGADLRKSYEVSVGGQETLDGQNTVHLELTPRNPEVAARLQRIELWLSTSTWEPLQQKFLEPSKDYLIARYRNVVNNGRLPAKIFELPLRGKVRTIRPQTGD